MSHSTMIYITIDNHGPELAYTDYWDSELAERGLCVLSWNAGRARLLLPDHIYGYGDTLSALSMMTKSRSVELESNDTITRIWFENDYPRPPFLLMIDIARQDRKLSKKDVGQSCKLLVYTRHGKALELPLKIIAPNQKEDPATVVVNIIDPSTPYIDVDDKDWSKDWNKKD